MKKIRRFAAAAALLSAAGCFSLPDGDPPAGGITDNRPAEAVTPAALRSRLATRIAASALAASPRWDSLVLECEADLLPLVEAAAQEAAAVAFFTVIRGSAAQTTPPGPRCPRLCGKLREGGGREITLLSPEGVVLWRDLLPPPSSAMPR